jgi:hypothetical protein
MKKPRARVDASATNERVRMPISRARCGRMRRRTGLAMILLLAIVATGCAGGDSPSSASTGGTSAAAPSSTSAAPLPPLVGRWEQLHVCDDLVDAMDAAGLGAIAVYEVRGQFYPSVPVEQLMKESDICAGSEPFRHAHFFDESGNFGSLDQQGNQVDNGAYTIVDETTVRIGDSVFRYRVTDGDTLTLRPVISKAARRKSLDNPEEFTEAVWMVSVAFTGTTWERVDCEAWC